MTTFRYRTLLDTILLAVLIMFAAMALFGIRTGTGSPGHAAAAYILLMLLPGAAFACIVSRRPRVLDLLLHSLLTSPVLTGTFAAIMLLAGSGPAQTAATVVFTSALFSAAVLLARRSGGIVSEIPVGKLLVLLGIAALFCAVTAYLPLSSEWWRMRSDAWFHASVVAEIDSYGIPPQDPYFAGMPLQYMWFYHVIVLTIARATLLDSFIAMNIINIQALAAFVVATFLFSYRLAGSRGRFWCGIAAVLVAVLGINAIFWVFIPLKLLRIFSGDVTGIAEAKRLLSLTPFDKHTVRSFLEIYYNQVFFLDKFIVSTAFSGALAYMGMFWYGVTHYLDEKRPHILWLVAVATVGLLTFHPDVGFIMGMSLASGLLLLWLKRNSLHGYSFAHTAILALVVFAALVVTAPYIYLIMHAKETSNAIPFGLSASKTIGFAISCALPALLALFQTGSILRRRETPEMYVLLATLAITVFSLVIVLPTSNTFDKPPFFIYYPLAVIGARTLVAWRDRIGTGFRRTAAALLLFALLLLPSNLIAILGYYNTPASSIISPEEEKMASWVQAHTARDAIFIDSGDNVFLLVTGPRRYYWGNITYAEQWGYDYAEMEKRKHVRDNLFSGEPIDKETLDALASIEQDCYVIVREKDGRGARRDESVIPPQAGMDKFKHYPALFEPVYSTDGLILLQVNKEACRTWSRLQPEQ